MRLCSKVSLGKVMGAALTSEKVHEVLGHIAVGGEDLTDARGPRGPRPAWGALHRVGHPLEQTLTCETQSVVGTGSRGHWPLFEVRAQGPLAKSQCSFDSHAVARKEPRNFCLPC